MTPSEVAEAVARAAASKVPYAGGILSALIGAFWPKDEVNFWDLVKDQVEKLVSQRIAENNLNELKLTLQGLHKAVEDYERISNPSQKEIKLNNIDSLLEVNSPRFLNGDPALGFSCFWSMALLHLSVRNELVAKYDDDENRALREEIIKVYCFFGEVAVNCIYHDRMNQLVLKAESSNVPGKNSQWAIDVSLKDEKNGSEIYSYHRFYRTDWNQDVLNRDTIECNQGLGPAWNKIATETNDNLDKWARNAINLMKQEYPYTEEEAKSLLKNYMSPEEYKTFEEVYLVRSKKTPVTPKVQLNPF